ncbi:MAG: metallophosphoesterase family protein [Bacteroidota bacterium]
MVTDIHAGCDHGSQLGSHAPLLLEEFLREMGRFKPDLVVDLGDRINNVNRAEDALHLHELVARTHVLRPLRHVPGNHDLVHLTLEENEAITRQPQGNRCETWQGWPVLFLNTETTDQPDLKRLLKDISQPVGASKENGARGGRVLLVFSHRPLVPVPLTRNPLFPSRESQNPPWGTTLVRELVELGWSPFCLNGHLHWNHVLTGRSFTQVTVAALVETWETLGKPSGSFAEVVVTSAGIEIHVMGRLASHYRFEWETPHSNT